MSRYRVYFVTENESLSSQAAPESNDVNLALSKLDEIYEEFYVGIYSVEHCARIQIFRESKDGLYNIEVSFGADAAYKLVGKEELADLLGNVGKIFTSAHELDFIEDESL